VRNHLLEGKRIAALCHTKMARDPASLQVVVSSTVELVLGCSCDETFWVEVVGELLAKFWKLEERCSWLEHHGTRICDLLLGRPPSRARLGDHPVGPNWATI
jgi:hypothetical protein